MWREPNRASRVNPTSRKKENDDEQVHGLCKSIGTLRESVGSDDTVRQLLGYGGGSARSGAGLYADWTDGLQGGWDDAATGRNDAAAGRNDAAAGWNDANLLHDGRRL